MHHPISFLLTAVSALFTGSTALFAAVTIDGSSLALILTALGGLITTCFTGYVAIRSLPQVHALVNSNYKEQKSENERLRNEEASKDAETRLEFQRLRALIDDLKSAAVIKAENRELRTVEHFAGVSPDSISPTPVVIANPEAVPVVETPDTTRSKEQH